MANRAGSATTENESTYRSVAALAADIGLSERSTRSALRRGEIPHIRLGRRFILPRAAIAEWLRTAGRRPESDGNAVLPVRSSPSSVGPVHLASSSAPSKTAAIVASARH